MADLPAAVRWTICSRASAGDSACSRSTTVAVNGSFRGDERQSRTDDGFPIDVTLLTYNRGQDTVNEIATVAARR